MFKRVMAFALAALMLLGICISVFAAEEGRQVTVLFTHDLHSHLLPATDEDGGQYGGYARLMTVIQQQREKYPDAILVDGGDFSMGSLFQTAYATDATELRMMGAMGYDATTFGNHEYDYLPSGFASMLNAAAASGDRVPAIVECNYLPPVETAAEYTSDSAAVWEAFGNYGVEDYILLERGGVYFAIFGMMGQDSDACAPGSGMILHDMAFTAQATLDAAVAECMEVYGAEPVVVCLSHAGTEDGQGEDYELAEAVTGIDVIVSGHTHTTLEEPIRVGDTYIVSAGEYGRYLGVVNLTFAGGKVTLDSYELIPVDETVAEDPRIAAMVEGFKTDVDEKYLANYGLTFDQVLTVNPYTFDTVLEVYATAHESTLCNIFSDAYKWAVEEATGLTVDMALTASGVIRESLPVGPVTVSDVFNAASLGVGTEGELVAVYVTGADLKNAIEVDASVQPIMRSAQLFMSGVEYTVNTNRMIFNKVESAALRRNDGTVEEIQDDELYLVVTGMYCGQMLGNVKTASYGLLNITPRNADGEPIDMSRLADFVVRDATGKPVKEWYAIASYLQTMGGQVDARYAQPDGRKIITSSWNPVRLLTNANHFTIIAVALILVLLGAVVLAVRAAVRHAGKKNK